MMNKFITYIVSLFKHSEFLKREIKTNNKNVFLICNILVTILVPALHRKFYSFSLHLNFKSINKTNNKNVFLICNILVTILVPALHRKFCL